MSGYPLSYANAHAEGSLSVEVIAGATSKSIWIKDFNIQCHADTLASTMGILYEFGTGSSVISNIDIGGSHAGLNYHFNAGNEWIKLGSGSSLYLASNGSSTHAGTNVYYYLKDDS